MTRIPDTRTHSYRDDARWDRIRELQEFIDAEEAAIEEEGWDEDDWEDEIPAEDVPAEVGGELASGEGADAPDAGGAAPEFPQPVPWPGGAR